MITKAGSKILSTQILNDQQLYIHIGEIKAMDGTLNQEVYYASSTSKFSIVRSDNVSGTNYGMIALLGVGDTPVTPDDYCLDEMNVGNVDVNTIIQCSAVFTRPTVTARGISYVFTFVNTGNTAITIKEMCLAMRFSGSVKYMIARKVIPPRTIQANETATFSYELDLF